MPSYEPTPRRFSVISVSRSASRRNSIDDPARPSLAQDPPRSCEAPTAINLTDALKLLQHVEVDEDRERGRSRQSADHIEPKVVLGHDGAVGAPFARRDNSASTRERIAVWEERSRSQSKGRSKSRGRDLGAGSRISIVPEVPELAAAFARFGRDKTELAGTGAVDIAAEDIETEKHDVRKRTSPRPQTPPRGCDDLLPTPDATPKRVASTSNGISPTIEIRKESQRWTGPEIQLPSEMPATPVQSGTAILPLTPEATPESHQSRTKGSTHVVTESESDRETLVAAYSNIFHRDGDSGWGEPNTVEPRRNPKLPSDSPVKATGIVDRTVSPNTRQKIGSGPDHRQEPDPQYHQVWRISSYEPDFPLPSRLSQTTGSTLPKEGHFDGNPLQQLPQSQQPTGVAAYRPRITSNAYPYRTDSTSSSRDWIVNVPNMTDQQRRHDHPPRHHEWDAPPVIERAIHAASVSMIQGLQVPLELYRGLREVYYPPPNRPNITKAYPIRRRLPVRIFFPTHHDLTSPTLLPTLFTIHGGAFTLGTPQDDDIWNRTFSDAHTILVISLNYSKSPWVSFPAPLKDLEAIYHSALNDDSLPIDRMRTAILGFDAGANLALGLSQLPSVKSGIDPSSSSSGTVERYPYFHQLQQRARCNPPPAAVISVCGILDFSVSPADKLRTRPYKKELKGPRGWGAGMDWVARLLPSSAWSYIPYGQDTTDALLSPVYSAREDLPPHVFVVAAELDCLAHESWRAAAGWSGGRRVVPSRGEVVGRKGVAVWRGCLDDGRGEDGNRFNWMEGFDHGRGSTRWLLVPDVVHGFDSAGWRNKYLWGDEEARMDAEMKTIAYQREVGEWLWGVVWR